MSPQLPTITMQTGDDGSEGVGSSAHRVPDFDTLSDLPELDDGFSATDGFSSEYPSTGDASLLGTELEVDNELVEQLEVDSVDTHDVLSLRPPSRLAVMSMQRGFITPFDDGATFHSNRSIAATDVEYTWENGRRYCGEYFMPNDKIEQTRLLLIHEVYKSVFDYEPTSVTLERPTHILDVGAGTGEWALDMADRFPDCEVTGTDIANVFPSFVPPNLFWEIDDAEIEWLRPPNSHDLVHFRNMAGAFADWSFIYQQAFRVIKPGGWIELLDVDDTEGFRNFLAFFEPDSPMHKVTQAMQEAAVSSGRPVAGHLNTKMLEAAGFVDVSIAEHAIPISPKELSTGHLFLKACVEGLEPVLLRLLTKYKGWTPEEVRSACSWISRELKAMAFDKERAKTFVIKINILTGRKPEDPSTWWPSETIFEEGQTIEADTREAYMGSDLTPEPHMDSLSHRDFGDTKITEDDNGSSSLRDHKTEGSMKNLHYRGLSLQTMDDRSEKLERELPEDSKRRKLSQQRLSMPPQFESMGGLIDFREAIPRRKSDAA